MTMIQKNAFALIRISGPWVAALLTLGQAAAQQAAFDALPEATKPFVVEQDSLLQFRLEARGEERWDLDHDVVRAVYRLAPDMDPLESPEATARAWLTRHGSRFGLRNMDALELVRHVAQQGVHLLTLQQMHQGLPVYNRTVQVNMGRNGLPSMVLSAYAAHMENSVSVTALPVVTAAEAREIAARAVSTGPVQTSDANLHYYPSESPRRVWQVLVWPDKAPGAWEVLLDADNGRLVLLMDRIRYGEGKG